MGFYCKTFSHAARGEGGEIRGVPSAEAAAGGGDGVGAGGTGCPVKVPSSVPPPSCSFHGSFLGTIAQAAASFLPLSPAAGGGEPQCSPLPAQDVPWDEQRLLPSVPHTESCAHTAGGSRGRFSSLGLTPGRAQLQEVEVLRMSGGNRGGFSIPQRNGGEALKQAGF